MFVNAGRGICVGSIRTEEAAVELAFRREEEEEEDGPAGLVPPMLEPESKELDRSYWSWPRLLLAMPSPMDAEEARSPLSRSCESEVGGGGRMLGK